MALDDVHVHIPMSDIDNMIMLDNNVLLEVFDRRDETKSGIRLPITIDNPFTPDNGIVYKMPKSVTCFDIGDHVIIEKYHGRRIYAKSTNRQFIMLDASYVLCKIED